MTGSVLSAYAIWMRSATSFKSWYISNDAGAYDARKLGEGLVWDIPYINSRGRTYRFYVVSSAGCVEYDNTGGYYWSIMDLKFWVYEKRR